jgi:hypothetical protein
MLFSKRNIGSSQLKQKDELQFTETSAVHYYLKQKDELQLSYFIENI